MRLIESPYFSIRAVNETSLLLEFAPSYGDDHASVDKTGRPDDPDIKNNVVISPQLANLIGNSAATISQEFPQTVHDCVASYTSLLIYFDCLRWEHHKLAERIASVIEAVIQHHRVAAATPGKLIHIPACYSPRYACDLLALAHKTGLSNQEIVQRHSKQVYSVYAVGFIPGFAYLGFVDPAIACARLDKPRLNVPAGSIGIADRQSGIYPTDSPGGWNIIGRTPLRLLDVASAALACPFAVGDQVKFEAISETEFIALQGKPL